VKILLTALTALFLTATPPSVAQDTGDLNNPPRLTQKTCAKISSVDKMLTDKGQTLFLTSKSGGDSEEFKINVYVSQKDRSFTIVKTFAKRNQACITMSGYDIELKNKIKADPKEEPSE
jgi:hypothetical protein